MKNLPLHANHEKAGARFGEFAGYQMPLYYSKPIEEHHQVRKGIGIFDISHMGQFLAEGERAEAFFQYALANNVKVMADGDALYSPMCAEDGGVLDDVILYRMAENRYRIIVNAGNHQADFDWLHGLASRFEVELRDLSDGLCLFAVQGPNALAATGKAFEQSPSELGYYRFRETRLMGHEVFLARTGYTGEPGYEVAVPAEAAPEVWEAFCGQYGAVPIGLAARDTLRLEACMALYGHELRREWNPLESGVSWAVKLNVEDDFVGKAAIEKVKQEGSPYLLAGLEVTGRGIPREHYPVVANGEVVGEVTSGALSPTTGKAVALAHLKRDFVKTGTEIGVEIRGKVIEAVVSQRPFYKSQNLRD